MQTVLAGDAKTGLSTGKPGMERRPPHISLRRVLRSSLRSGCFSPSAGRPRRSLVSPRFTRCAPSASLVAALFRRSLFAASMPLSTLASAAAPAAHPSPPPSVAACRCGPAPVCLSGAASRPPSLAAAALQAGGPYPRPCTGPPARRPKGTSWPALHKQRGPARKPPACRPACGRRTSRRRPPDKPAASKPGDKPQEKVMTSGERRQR